MAKRIILHLDMDYFFAQIEERENPYLRGKPVVVGADPKNGAGRGVVSTANYVARKFGIKSALPISAAWKLCSWAEFLPAHMTLYSQISGKIMKIIKQMAPQNPFEQVSIDEAFLDLSPLGDFESAEKLAVKIKQKIFEEEKLTASIGLGPNKLIAKIASDFKKPNGLTVILPDQVTNFLVPRDVKIIYGVGPKTAERLANMGVKTVKNLLEISEDCLSLEFGVWGEELYQLARGIDSRPVEESREIKSIGRQITFDANTRDKTIVMTTLIGLTKEVWQEAVSQNFKFRTVTITCRYSDFETIDRSKTIKEATDNFVALKSLVLRLFLPHFLNNKRLLRLVGVKVSHLSKEQQKLPIF